MHHVSRRQWQQLQLYSAVIIYYSLLNTEKIFINFVLVRKSSSESTVISQL